MDEGMTKYIFIIFQENVTGARIRMEITIFKIEENVLVHALEWR